MEQDGTIIDILQTLALAWLIWQRLRARKQLPALQPGERVAIVPRDHSNVTVTREGDQVIMTDEEFNKLDINKIVK